MIRKATQGDCSKIYDLVCDIECESLDYSKFTQIYDEQLRDSRYCCFVFECDSDIIAVLNLRFENQLHHAGCIAEIMEFAVCSRYRNQGIGKAMFRHACDFAKSIGCLQIEVCCNQIREGAHRFYLREGMDNSHFKFSKSLTDTNLV